MITWWVVTISLMLLLGAAPASKPAAPATSAPTTRGAAGIRRSDPGSAAIRAAVQALTKEYEPVVRGGGGAGTSVREESNYFTDHPDAASVTHDAVIAALASRTGGDPRTASYVKWQLLSALPDDGDGLDPAAAKPLLAAYRAAPLPAPRPGVAPHEQQKLDVLVKGRKQSDEADLKAALDTEVSRVARQNTVILRYRDALYGKLPKTPEAFAAAMEDLMQRLNAVASDEDLVKALVDDVREWATMESHPPHVMNALARAARRLADAKGPQYYQTPYWSSSNVFAWRKTRAGVDSASKLKDLAVYLEELAAQPQLELKELKEKS
jgi:hypothetical protein